MTDEQMNTINAQFNEMRGQFDEMRGRFGQIDRQFEAVHDGFGRLDQRLTRVEDRLTRVDDRLTRVEGRLTNVEGEVTGHGRMLETLDTRVHQLGMRQEERHAELKLAYEQFQMLQRATNARLDLQRESFERRVDPLELTSRHHAGDLERHDRRLTTLEAPPSGDDHSKKADPRRKDAW